MNIALNLSLADNYKSPAQQARVVTESWAQDNLYCAACDSIRVERTPNNTEGSDFYCGSCRSSYQLKASKSDFGARVVDGAYEAMLRSLRAKSSPHLLLLRYDVNSSCVRRLILIPRHFISSSSIERRKPLASHARRAGWIGCYINLERVPDDGKITLIDSGKVATRRLVRERFGKTSDLSRLSFSARGWALDVLTMIRGMRKMRFSLADVYSYEQVFKEKYPGNRHIRPKIRQQLQVLRDMGLVDFLGTGQYHLRYSA
ncbi:MAG: restriction endonuclease [Elusimicrobia bacterium]|nr:restriction endonuclease [Elusimicrobiota bacterium]